MKTRTALDVSHLPTYGFGPAAPVWWGTLSFIVIEGLGFVFAIGVYFYLLNQNDHWPLNPPPQLLWGSLLTLLLLLSEIPNHFTKKAAKAMDVGRLRLGLVIMSLVGLVALALRWFEFTSLNVRWDSNVYGSVLWLILGLHTTHLITDLFETLVFTVLILKGPVDARRCSDAEDNQNYWDFVVLTWLPLYAVIYWVPQLGVGA